MSMPEYKVTVTTGTYAFSGTSNNIFVTIHGSEAQSERTALDNWGPDFWMGQVGWKRASFLHQLNGNSQFNKLL